MNMLSFLLGAPISAQRASQGLTAESSELPALKAYYDQNLEPLCRKFENQRLTALKHARKRFYLAASGYVAAALFAFPFMRPNAEFAPMIWMAAFALAIICWRWATSPMRHFSNDVQSEIYPLIFRYFGPDFVFAKGKDMGLRMFKDANILPSYDKANFDDCVLGTHLGLKIGINEVHLTRQDASNNNRTQHVTVFRGLVISLASHKPFKGHTVVIRSRGSLTNFLSDSYGGLERVRLEDPQFEKLFDVFSSDQIEARVLLTTAFMERLLDLARFFKSHIQCAFHHDRLLITIESRHNRFEQASIFKGATFEYEFSQINAEMKQLFAIIELLKLNEYTGL